MSALSVRVRAAVGTLALDVEFDVNVRGLLLIGPNGAGKTSVLLSMLGARRPDEGRIALDGEAVFDSAARIDVPIERRRIGYVPQDYGLFPHLTAIENVMFALAGAPERKPRAAARAHGAALLRGLQVAHVADARPAQLSAGERQRVALARALASAPRALVLDEPLAALDVATRHDVRGFLREHLGALGRPFVLVSHDLDDVMAFDAEVAVLEGGRLVQQGARAALQAQPGTPFVRAFFYPRG